MLKLRDFLDNYWDRRIELVTEFFYINKIYENKYYKLQHLENFANYIYDNISENTNVIRGIIDTKIPMKHIIDKGIQYKNYYKKKSKISKSMSVIRITEKRNDNNNKINYNNNKYLRSNQTIYSFRPNNRSRYLKLRKSKSAGKILTNTDTCYNCFYSNDYNYDIYDDKEIRRNRDNEKIEKYKKFLDKNYGVNVSYKFMRKYNKKEIDNYFNKRKVGTVFIPDKNNLFNNIKKQLYFNKRKNHPFSKNKNSSIYTFSEKECKDLYKELKETKENYIKNRKENNVWKKMYENIKKNKFEKHPDMILKKKKKLLEYIIFESIQRRKEFEKEVLK